MPRINATTIAEHVATQEVAVVDAARRLFSARGFAAVSLADIAAEIGLSRTALYRYFPTKGHILERWFDQAMAPLVERSREVAEGDGTVGERLVAWLDVQLAFLADPAHAVLVEASAAPDALSPEVRAEMGARHRELYATLTPMLGTSDPDLQRTRTTFLAGLVRSAAELVRGGADEALVRAELHRAGAAIAAPA